MILLCACVCVCVPQKKGFKYTIIIGFIYLSTGKYIQLQWYHEAHTFCHARERESVYTQSIHTKYTHKVYTQSIHIHTKYTHTHKLFTHAHTKYHNSNTNNTYGSSIHRAKPKSASFTLKFESNNIFELFKSL